MAEVAREAHDVLRDGEGNSTLALEKSTYAIAEVELADGSTAFYAAGNGPVVSPAGRDVLMDYGIPEDNIFSGKGVKKGFREFLPKPENFDSFTEDQLKAHTKAENILNHAERVIERNIPEGAKIKRIGISWSSNQKNEMCSHCKKHFGCK